MRIDYGCRHIRETAPNCRTVQVQERMLEAGMEWHTTRLSEKKMPQLSSPQLGLSNGVMLSELTSHVNIIKGLFIQPIVKPRITGSRECIKAQPIIVFGKPNIGGTKYDYQHVDLARSLGLTERVRLSDERARILGVKYESGLAKGVWGFTISPLTISLSPNTKNTRVVFSTGVAEPGQITINAEREKGIVDPQTEKVDLLKLRNIEEETAEKLWKQNVYAFLFRGSKRRDREVWIVRASSGIKGPMESIDRALLPEFLDALALHVSPEFKVFRFLRIGEVYQRNRISVSWAETKRPNCLHWSRELRLCHGKAPTDWWGERV